MIGQSLFPMSLDLLRPPGGAAVPPARGGACVSIRSLQEGFRRHLDMTPTQYLREVRLARAHEDLRLAEPSQATVTRIAHNSGFTSVGRFAQMYAKRYGNHPSETRRSPSPGPSLILERSPRSAP
ncbi:MAG: transcriptional regulator, AraC family [Pseudonocardiales bacterium]|nr:transcriptional regulator, AraC family [Pseudonocardiales bacterium]